MDHARVWIDAGHEVTVVTCVPNFPQGKVFQGYQNRIYQEESIEGLRIIRLYSYTVPNSGFIKRIVDQSSFMVSAVLQSWRFPDFDVILATSPPLFVAMAGYLISLVRRRPWIFEIRDLWPASIQAVGLGEKTPISFLEKVELFLYNKATRIISLSPAFVDNLVRRGISSEKNDLVTNGVDTKLFSPENVKEDIRSQLRLDQNCFLVAYFGTTGMAHGLETLLEAAQKCLSHYNIKFLIVGEGGQRKALERRAEDLRLTNLMFLDFVVHEKTPDYYAALDLFIVHLKPHPVFKTVIPSKIFEAMAMEVPMLCAVEGEGEKIVSSTGSGICIPPGDSTAMATAILWASENCEELKIMGENGRKSAVSLYSRQLKAEECLASFRKALGN